MLGKPPFQRPYQPLGDLRLRFPGQRQVRQYLRDLNLDEAISRTSYRNGDVVFTREVFVSFPDQALAVRLSSSKAGQVSFDASIDNRPTERGGCRQADNP